MTMDSENNRENDLSPFADIKALIDFLRVIFDLFENETLNKKGARHLFSLYVVLSELLKDFDKYVLYIKENFIELDSENNAIFWEVNKLADSVARKHYELYRLLEGLDYGLNHLECLSFNSSKKIEEGYLGVWVIVRIKYI